jgi:glycosyltransferase involved in cell wall biosynthesis
LSGTGSQEGPIRVAHVIWSLGLGGAEQVVIRLAAGLDRSRFEPIVVCLDQPGVFAPVAEEAGVPVTALGKRGALDARALVRLERLLVRRRVDVVHTHLWGADFWGRMAARAARTPIILSTAHNVDTWKKPYHFVADRLLARVTSRLVAVSDEVRHFYESRGVGRGRWQVVYNGVADAATRARGRGPAFTDLGIGADSPVVALIGRLVPAKAPSVFLEAVAQASAAVPDLRALIIGDGPLRASLEERARELGLGARVVFAGLRRDVPELLAGIDVLAFSSEREGLSIAMLEAMAAGVPVVATRVGGTPELIESGASGILVPPGQARALADALAALLTTPALAESMSRAALERVRTRFSLRHMVESYEALYSEARRPAAPALRP